MATRKILRSLVPGHKPKNLLEGQLAVNIPDRLLWIGDERNRPILIPEVPPGNDFEGAGSRGLVPDPITERGYFLKDDGTWDIVEGTEGPEGPQGPPGEDGEPGPPGASFTIRGFFGYTKTPSDLPANGFIPANWDGPGRPVVGFQAGSGDALLYQPPTGPSDPQYGDLYAYIPGDSAWTNVGKLWGPVGPQGPEGPEGPEGVQGPIGLPGEQGPKGDTGDPGKDGNEGPQGIEGPEGDRGPEGPQGVAGPQGPQGVKGDDGPIGPVGPQGSEGPEGAEGPQGPIGPKGPAGDSFRIRGYFGTTKLPSDLPPNGLIPADWDGPGRPINATQYVAGDALYYQPAIGPSNPEYGDLYAYSPTSSEWVNVGKLQGPPGESGPIGPPGPRGFDGPAGPQGPQGTQGVPGDVGPQGPEGPEGPQGPRGNRGLQGFTGPAGPTGAKGPQGEQGPMGFTGPTGAQGPRGAQGPQGIDGKDGERGPMGPQGPEGPQGPPGDGSEGGMKVFFQAFQPTDEESNQGDIWFVSGYQSR